ncbi:MAG: hypothetical protein ABSB95_16215 [Dissulfurispiraceae bacterium]|jgi:hypothetical protein
MKTGKYIVIMTMFASILALSIRMSVEAEEEKLPHPELYKLHLIKKKLKCGDAELFAESACFDTTDNPNRQCRKQTIKLVNSKKGISKNLPLVSKPVKKNFKESPGPVLNMVVTDIGCLESATGKHFINLYYVCNWGRDCYGTNTESERFYSVEGVYLPIRKREDLKKYGIPETGGTYIHLTSSAEK